MVHFEKFDFPYDSIVPDWTLLFVVHGTSHILKNETVITLSPPLLYSWRRNQTMTIKQTY